MAVMQERQVGADAVPVDLVAVVLAVTQGQPRVLTTQAGQALPAGPFQRSHRSLQAGLRAWVEQQTHHRLGYVEQLYTFADRDRVDGEGAAMSISYLALTREAPAPGDGLAHWHDWYRYFPWEDHRAGVPAVLTQRVVPALHRWMAADAADAAEAARRQQRAALTFGLDGSDWNEDLVLQRYELLYEAGLIPEATRVGRPSPCGEVVPGEAMLHDHRRILATGMARLRAKIKYRPVVFELMPETFTFLHLQQTVEALAGQRLHKQNFRRLFLQQELVEETGELLTGAAGRPARLLRFRGGVMQERAIAGSKLPLARAD